MISAQPGLRRKGKKMRKQLALVILLVLVAGSILTVAGCGNKDKAKDYMKTGDELSTKLAGLNNAFKSFDLFKFLEEVGVELNESGSIDPATITDTTNEQLDTMIRTGTEAKAEYGKILDLGGVEDYKEYAAARIDAIDSTISIIEDVQLLLDTIADTTNTASTSEKISSWLTSSGVVSGSLSAYSRWNDAKKIKENHGL